MDLFGSEVYQAYTDSELCGFTFTDDAYLALFQLMKRAYDVKHWNCTKPELPVLFYQRRRRSVPGQCAAVCSGSSENERRRLQGCKRETLSGNAP